MPLDPLAAALVAVEDNADILAEKAAELVEPVVLSTAHSAASKVADSVARQTAHEIATKAGTDALEAVERHAERLSGDVTAYLAAHPAEKGETGDKGDSIKGDTGLNWRGAFVKGTIYQTDDAVENGGSSYVASRPTKATPPSGAWDLLAKKGRDGKDANSPMWFGGGGSGGGGAVTSVNGQTGVVVLGASDVSAAPDSVNYLVGTASAGLSAEIAVGTTPGGELGNTWASPTVDTTHSGSTHAATQAAAEATAAGALASHEADTTSVHGIANTANLVLVTLVDAKGDLLAGTAADTLARLAVGTNGFVLTADSGETTGLKWAAAAGGSPSWIAIHRWGL